MVEVTISLRSDAKGGGNAEVTFGVGEFQKATEQDDIEAAVAERLPALMNVMPEGKDYVDGR